MYWLDTTILVFLGLGAILGFWSGLLWQVARFAGLGLAIYASTALHEQTSHLLREFFLRDADHRVVQISAYISVFLIAYLLLFLVTRVLKGWIRAVDLEFMDRLLGAFLGTVKMGLILGCACLILNHVTHPAAKEWFEKSTMAPHFSKGLEASFANLPEEYQQNFRDTFINLKEGIQRNAMK